MFILWIKRSRWERIGIYATEAEAVEAGKMYRKFVRFDFCVTKS